MMELGEAKKELETAISSACEPFGFLRQSPLVWLRSKTADEFLLAGLRKDARGYFAVTASVAIRFGAISKLLEGSPTNGIHINIPMHLLSSERKFAEWQFTDKRQIEALIPLIAGEFGTRAMPFFERFGTLEGMRDKLRLGTPKDWFALSAEQRTELLAAIEVALGHQTDALKLIDDALVPLRDALPKKRYALEALRAKLVS